MLVAPPVPAPTRPYVSFLACFHPDVTNLYVNGLPIGLIEGGAFKVHEYMVRGNPRPLRFHDLAHPVPFKTVEELKASLIAAIQAIQIEEPRPDKPEAKS